MGGGWRVWWWQWARRCRWAGPQLERVARPWRHACCRSHRSSSSPTPTFPPPAHPPPAPSHADTSFKGTLFAPTDKAFAEALAELDLNVTDLLADKPLLGSLLS